MRRVRDCMRLKNAGISTREIARRVGVASSTVRLTLRRCEAAGIAWPLDVDLTDAVLEQRLFANCGTKHGHRRHEGPDWAAMHREMKRKHVTLSILWEEYIERDPGGYRYSRFCDLYLEWEARLPVTMRQTHAAGERLFVDYAGDGVPVVIDRLTGEIDMAQIFVAVLGASSFTFARASWTQTLHDWIDAHVHAIASTRLWLSTCPPAIWTIDRLRADARLIGPATAALCKLILEQRPHPEQGFRACLGIVRLVAPYGVERLEAAAQRAIEIGARTYGSVKSILDNNLDRCPAQKRATDGTPIQHVNIRGPRYYH